MSHNKVSVRLTQSIAIIEAALRVCVRLEDDFAIPTYAEIPITLNVALRDTKLCTKFSKP